MKKISAWLAICAGNSPIPVNSPHKGQEFSLICFWINDWVNNRKAGDLGRYRAQINAIVMILPRIANTLLLVPFCNSGIPKGRQFFTPLIGMATWQKYIPDFFSQERIA